MKLTDESLMRFGRYKNVPMKDVPATYLMWVYDTLPRKENIDTFIYIEENMDVLKKEIQNVQRR